MGRCAPCLGMDEKRYRGEVIDEMTALLRGEGGEEHLVALVGERDRLSRELEFEAAARLRDLISGIQRIRVARAVVNAEGLRAVVAPSTEPDVVEVFVFSEGRLMVHKGFEGGDESGLEALAKNALAWHEASAGRRAKDELPTADEGPVVSAYLRRRVPSFEAVRLEGPQDPWPRSSGWLAYPP